MAQGGAPSGVGGQAQTGAAGSGAGQAQSSANSGGAQTGTTVPARDTGPYVLSQWWSAGVAIVFLIVVLIITVTVGKKDGVNFFQSPDGAVSVSKVQVWMWTMAIIFAYVYLSLWVGPPGTPGKGEFPNSLWELMGISALSTGTARYIAVTSGKADQSIKPEVAEKIKKQNWVVSMLSDDGQPSMMRLQLFGWTLVTIFLFMIVLYRDQKLWDVPQTLVILMGISHAGYLGDKGAAASKPS